MKKTVSVILSFCFMLSMVWMGALPASAAWSGGFNYTVSGGKATIMEYSGAGGAVTIPSTLGGYPVVSINGFAAYMGNENVTSVTIPNCVTSIGGDAFSGCEVLTKITIGSGVRSIGEGGIQDCPKLTQIVVDANNSVFSSQNGVLFNKAKTTLIHYPGGRIGSYAVPTGVTAIGEEAFGDCNSNLTGVTFPGSLTSIGDVAFMCCSGLTAVSIPSSVTSIGSQAFQQTGLKTVTIPGSVKSVGDNAFEECTSLTSVTLESGVSTIGEWAFASCSSLTSVSIPASVNSIGAFALDYTPWMQNYPGDYMIVGNHILLKYKGVDSEVSVPDGVLKICDYAFFNTALTGVTIPNSVISIGLQAFRGTAVSQISVNSGNSVYSSADGVLFDKAQKTLILYPAGGHGSYTVPTGTTVIGSHAFEYCGSITGVTFPDTVTSIGNDAFDYCQALTQVSFGSGLTGIGNEAFSGTGLTSVTIPNSVASIGKFAFDSTPWYENLTGEFVQAGNHILIKYNGTSSSVVIPDGVRIIAGAVMNDLRMKKVTIPASVTSIGGEAFMDSNLSAALFLGNAPAMGSNAFEYCTSGFTFYYLSGSTGFTNPWHGYKTALFPAVQSVSAVSAGYNSIRLNWNDPAPATGYEVWWNGGSGTSYKLLTAVTGSGYIQSGLTTNKTYSYKVRAYVLKGTVRVYSPFSPVVCAKPVPSTPSGLKAWSASYNSVRLSWGGVSGASAYQVYRATSSTGTYSLLATTTAAGYTNGSLATGRSYYYKIRAYRTVGTTKVYGNYTGIVCAKPVPSTPSVTLAKASSTSIKISWGGISGASGYEVYRAASSTGTYSLIRATTATGYTNTGLTAGKTYYYKVRAYRMVGTAKVYGAFSTVKYLKI